MSKAGVYYTNVGNEDTKISRSEEEIDNVLSALREVWLRHPGQRLTQIVVHVGKHESPTGEVTYDVGYVEDDEWVEKATEYPY